MRREDRHTDMELIEAVRGGDTTAYGTLYRRHSAAARSLARQLVQGEEAVEDLLVETFAKVLEAVRRGGGPASAFRPYLLASLRRYAAAGVADLADGDSLYVDPELAGLERAPLARAFRSLPERWRMLLWHMEIEDATAADTGALLGVPGKTAVRLLAKARRSLREAYVRLHMENGTRAECRPVLSMILRYVHNGLPKAEAGVVDAHVAECIDCRSVFLELVDLTQELRAVVGQLVAGPAVNDYLADLAATTARGTRPHGGGMTGDTSDRGLARGLFWGLREAGGTVGAGLRGVGGRARARLKTIRHLARVLGGHPNHDGHGGHKGHNGHLRHGSQGVHGGHGGQGDTRTRGTLHAALTWSRARMVAGVTARTAARTVARVTGWMAARVMAWAERGGRARSRIAPVARRAVAGGVDAAMASGEALTRFRTRMGTWVRDVPVAHRAVLGGVAAASLATAAFLLVAQPTGVLPAGISTDQDRTRALSRPQSAGGPVPHPDARTSPAGPFEIPPSREPSALREPLISRAPDRPMDQPVDRNVDRNADHHGAEGGGGGVGTGSGHAGSGHAGSGHAGSGHAGHAGSGRAIVGQPKSGQTGSRQGRSGSEPRQAGLDHASTPERQRVRGRIARHPREERRQGERASIEQPLHEETRPLGRTGAGAAAPDGPAPAQHGHQARRRGSDHMPSARPGKGPGRHMPSARPEDRSQTRRHSGGQATERSREIQRHGRAADPGAKARSAGESRTSPRAALVAAIDPLGSLLRGQPGLVAVRLRNAGGAPTEEVTTTVTLPPGVVFVRQDGRGRAGAAARAADGPGSRDVPGSGAPGDGDRRGRTENATGQDRETRGLARRAAAENGAGDGWTCATAGRLVRCVRGPLAPGEVTAIFLRVAVAADAPTGRPFSVRVRAARLVTTTMSTAGVRGSGAAARFAADGRLVSRVVGNVLVSTAAPAARCGAAAGGRNRDAGVSVAVDLDGDPSTRTSSCADLDLPAGGQVLWAGLYWSGGGRKALPEEDILVRAPGSPGYVTVRAAEIDRRDLPTGPGYQAFTDVTSLVRTAGEGRWWVAGAPGRTGPLRHAAWGLVVLATDPRQPYTRAVVLDAAAAVGDEEKRLRLPLDGLAPDGAPARIDLMVWNGEGVRAGVVTVSEHKGRGDDRSRADVLGRGDAGGIAVGTLHALLGRRPALQLATSREPVFFGVAVVSAKRWS